LPLWLVESPRRAFLHESSPPFSDGLDCCRRASLDWTAEGGCPYMSVPKVFLSGVILHTLLFWARRYD